MRFNMGCGRRRLDGYVNVDAEALAEPDQVWDLEQTPWPWPDDCASEVQFIHSLEHMGGDPRVFLAIMRELYRICADGAVIKINVPHPRHDNFLSDPTHVRAITAETLRLFDSRLNEAALSMGGSNSPLGLYLGVDFEIVREGVTLDDPYWTNFREGRLSESEVRNLLRERNNIACELRFELRVRKPTTTG